MIVIRLKKFLSILTSLIVFIANCEFVKCFFLIYGDIVIYSFSFSFFLVWLVYFLVCIVQYIFKMYNQPCILDINHNVFGHYVIHLLFIAGLNLASILVSMLRDIDLVFFVFFLKYIFVYF